MNTADNAGGANSVVIDHLRSHLDTPGAQSTDHVQVGGIGNRIFANIAKIWIVDYYSWTKPLDGPIWANCN